MRKLNQDIGLHIRRIVVISDFLLKREAESSGYALFASFCRSFFLLLVMWLVFDFGLKAKLSNGGNYFIYFAPAYIGWSIISESTLSAFAIVKGNKFICENSETQFSDLYAGLLLKNLLVALLMFLMLLFLVIVVVDSIDWSILFIIPAIGYAASLTYICIWLSVELSVRNSKIGYYLPVFINLLFWASPIVWQVDIIPNNLLWLFEYNPIYVMAEAFRYSFGIGFGRLQISTFCIYSLISIALVVIIWNKLNVSKVHILDSLR